MNGVSGPDLARLPSDIEAALSAEQLRRLGQWHAVEWGQAVMYGSGLGLDEDPTPGPMPEPEVDPAGAPGAVFGDGPRKGLALGLGLGLTAWAAAFWAVTHWPFGALWTP